MTIKAKVSIREYRPNDASELAEIFFNTIHEVNAKDYSKDQLEVWAPTSTLNSEGWAKKFNRTKPLVAVFGDKIVGFAEFEEDGHIDCFYCHHEWIGKGVGSALMKAIFRKAEELDIHRIFVEASITARSFFEKNGFVVLKEQQVVKDGVKLTNYKMEIIK